MTTFRVPEEQSSPVLNGFAQLTNRANERIEQIQVIDVHENSPMAADDRAMTKKSYRETVAVPIASAFDHLRLTGASVVQLRGSLPFATATPIRSAITTAATSLWLMDDSKTNRRQRVLQYWIHDNKRLQQFIENGHVIQPGAGTPMEQQDLRQQALQQVWDQREAFFINGERLELPRAVLKHCATDTEMVSAAGALLPKDSFDGFDPVIEVAKQWRLLSGHAHGFRWPHLDTETQAPGDGDGWTSVTLKSNAEKLLASALIALQLAETALNRFVALSSPMK